MTDEIKLPKSALEANDLALEFRRELARAVPQLDEKSIETAVKLQTGEFEGFFHAEAFWVETREYDGLQPINFIRVQTTPSGMVRAVISVDHVKFDAYDDTVSGAVEGLVYELQNDLRRTEDKLIRTNQSLASLVPNLDGLASLVYERGLAPGRDIYEAAAAQVVVGDKFLWLHSREFRWLPVLEVRATSLPPRNGQEVPAVRIIFDSALLSDIVLAADAICAISRLKPQGVFVDESTSGSDPARAGGVESPDPGAHLAGS
jgi:hypothetical protein